MSDRLFRRYRLAIRLFAVLGVGLVLFVVADRVIAPSGRVSVTTDLVSPVPFLGAAMPAERLAKPETDAYGRSTVRLLSEPVYLDLTPPGDFDKVDLAVTYENSGQPEFRLGALTSALDQAFDLRPAENRFLDTLNWPRLESGRLVLYQRERRYASLDEFFRQPPPREKVATLGTATAIPFRLAGYVAGQDRRRLDINLRGAHRLLTYVRDETLDFAFTVQDMNRLAGADPVIVSVWREEGERPDRAVAEQPLARAVLDDDGNSLDDQKSSGLRTVAVTALGLPEGAYVVEFTAPDDVFVREIATPQLRVAFAGKVYLGDVIGYSPTARAVTLHAAGREVVFRTGHPEGAQTVRVGGAALTIVEPGVRYAAALADDGRPVAVVVPRGDMVVETDGVLALSPESYFNPLPWRPDWRATVQDLERRRIDFILADYVAPTDDGRARTARVTFDAGRLARTERGAWRFVLAAPGLDLTGARLAVRSVSFTLRRDAAGWAEAWRRFLLRQETTSAAAGGGPRTESYGETVR